MYRYLIYGMVVESEVEFMQLMKAQESVDPILLQDGNNNGKADLFIRQVDCKDEVIEFLTKENCLKRKYYIGLEESAFLNKGGYYFIRGGNEIKFEMNEGYTTATVSSWLLGFAMTMALLQRRVLAIHCSAVTGDEGAFIISGEPGAGKSSLTRKLLERDYKIMADDVAAVRVKESSNGNGGTEKSAVVYPAFPYQKLCRNEVESRNFDMNELIYIGEEKDKFLVPVKDKFVVEPQKLKFMAFLRKGNVDEVVVKKLAGFEQLMGFRQNIFLHRLYGDWEKIPEVMNLTLAIASHCPVYMIVRPEEGNSQDIMANIVEKINRGEEL